ncbi:MAG: hypothetical protein Ct9H300mP28_29320 [Pseudomonadota bacterium]|nr:MAG: hypothetical protein Ct9H300mP28_29320 [Pseudomonadota bacterium]
MFLGPHKPELCHMNLTIYRGSVSSTPCISQRVYEEIGLEKKEGQLPEPEDTLGFEFEIMNWMISKQTSMKMLKRRTVA